MAPWSNILKTARRGALALTVKERFETPPGTAGTFATGLPGNGRSIFAKIDPANDAPGDDWGRINAVQTSPIAMACVRKIAWNAASVKLGVEFLNGDLDFDHPIAQRLAAPNSEGGKWGLIQLVASSLATCGRAYVYGLKSAFDNTAPQALIFLRPDHIQKRWNSDGTLLCYQYNSGYRGVVDLAPETVCEFKHPWIGDDSAIPGSGRQEAYSQMTAAWGPLTMFQGLSGLMNRLLKNNGGLPGILTWNAPDGDSTLTNEQRAAMRTYIEGFKADGESFGKIAMLDSAGGKIEFLKITEDFKSLNMEAGKKSAMLEICAVFGVPPLLLMPGDATFANAAEARRSFWMETVIPGYIDVIADGFSQWFGITIKPDLTQIPALADYNMTLATSLQSMDYLTINEKRAKMGYQNVLGGDVLMLNPSMIPINRLINSQTGSLADQAGWLQDQDTLRRAMETGVMPGVLAPSNKPGDDAAKTYHFLTVGSAKSLTPEQRAKHAAGRIPRTVKQFDTRSYAAKMLAGSVEIKQGGPSVPSEAATIEQVARRLASVRPASPPPSLN